MTNTSSEKYNNLIFRFLRQSSHYFSGYALSMICGLISFPILTRVFSRSGYGTLSLISTTLWILLAVAKLGMQESAVRFYNEFKVGQRKDDFTVYYSTLYFGSLGSTLVILLLAYSLTKLFIMDLISNEMQHLIWFVMLMLISSSMFARLTNFLRAEQQTKLLNGLIVVDRYLGLGLALVFLMIFGKTLKSYYAGVIVAEMLIVILLTLYYVHHKRLTLRGFSFSFLKEAVLFGIPFVGLELSDYLIKSTDRYLIQIYLGLESVGLYAAVSNLCIYIKDGILFPMVYAITPIYMELWARQGAKATREFLSKVFNYLLMIMIPIVFGFSILGKQVIVLMASKEFEASAGVIPFLIPGTLLWGISPIFAAGFYIQKETKKLTLIVFLGVCLNIILNMLLLPHLGLRGSALANLITYFILLCLLNLYSLKDLRPAVNITRVLKSFSASVIMTLCLQWFNFPVSFFYLFINILSGATIYAGLMLLIDKDIRNSLSRHLTNGYLVNAK
ncbi:MAG: polysaccharide biosynthesis C-terminal domain-containing protein [candidate division KSB1 bacterium]|nr:polysaccharide biosynthesis C-terminal domain-containing protein [candidate division KSB1 bacterium]MDZ7336509.1 polysaccharide biosynthesis C-terminal domain-containing protein [candidate division KSB1 bacterium]